MPGAATDIRSVTRPSWRSRPSSEERNDKSLTLLAARAAEGRPVRVGLIGAGKFGSMVLAQAQRIRGYHMVAVADLNVGKAREVAGACRLARRALFGRRAPARRVKTGTTFVTDDVEAMLACDEIECVIEATGHPLAGTRHALAAIDAGKHVVMVNVEADVMVGPILAEKARREGPGLFDGLRRPAGADLRAGRLGARHRLRGDGRRQGHELRAALPLFDPGHGLELLRLDRRGGRQGRLQSEDVQLLHRRHQGRDRDGGGRQRHRPRLPGRRPRLPAGRPARPRPGVPPGGGRRPHGEVGPRRHRRQPGAGRPRGVQQHPLRRLRHLQGAQRILARPASSSTAC